MKSALLTSHVSKDYIRVYSKHFPLFFSVCFLAFAINSL